MKRLTPTPTTLYIEIGRRIQQARRTAGITQAELADAIGLSRTSMSNIERGRHKILLHKLEDVSRVVGISLHGLIPDRRFEKARLENQLPTNVSSDLRGFISGILKRRVPLVKKPSLAS